MASILADFPCPLHELSLEENGRRIIKQQGGKIVTTHCLATQEQIIANLCENFAAVFTLHEDHQNALFGQLAYPVKVFIGDVGLKAKEMACGKRDIDALYSLKQLDSAKLLLQPSCDRVIVWGTSEWWKSFARPPEGQQ